MFENDADEIIQAEKWIKIHLVVSIQSEGIDSDIPNFNRERR